MTPEESLQTIQTELAAGIVLAKCQQCGCMDSTLKHLAALLPHVGTEEAFGLAASVAASRKNMRPMQYACLGCAYCYPAVAQNAFAQAFPALSHAADVDCAFPVRDAGWPLVVGEYFVLDKDGTVAVSTLASIPLAEALAQRNPRGLAIVGKTETENIGLDKVIKNIVTSPSLRYLIVAGRDPSGHLPGRTLVALAHHGVDAQGRVIGDRLAGQAPDAPQRLRGGNTGISDASTRHRYGGVRQCRRDWCAGRGTRATRRSSVRV
jgi:tetrahydromethanopterin S-methyltransferase subunit A